MTPPLPAALPHSTPPEPEQKCGHTFTEEVTQRCIDFIVQGAAHAPADAVHIARRCFVDTLGLAVAGLHERATRILLEAAIDQGGKPEARLLAGNDRRVPAVLAARVLGTSAHAHDFDDTQVSHDPNHVYGLLTHPSAPPLAAALVLADLPGAEVSFARLLDAFLVGFEVEAKISEWMPADHYLRGHHSSGTVGTFGATAAACRMLGLQAAEVAHALGIAASFAAGIRCNFGTMTKPLHVGRAAENGVLASLLAQRGYTADPAALDGRWGFPAVLAGGFTASKVAEGFGNTWTIADPGVSIKPYPSGILTHQTMDAARSLLADHAVDADAIESIDIHAGDNILDPIRYPIAANGLQAKFSLPALVAMIALYRHASIHEFDDAKVASAPMQAMQRRIRTHRDAAINAQGFDRIRSRVEVLLKDGRRLVREADVRYRGGPLMPMNEADIEEKLRGCVRGLIGEAQTRALLDLLKPDSAPAPSSIVGILAGARMPA